MPEAANGDPAPGTPAHDRQWREVPVPVATVVFSTLGVVSGRVSADYIQLQHKHPDQFASPADVRRHVEFVLAAPAVALAATKPTDMLLTHC